MVYNINELVKRMAAGETPDAIAAEMTNMLNAASVQHQNAIRAEEEAKRAAQRKIEEKHQEMGEILMHIANFLQTYYPDMCAEAVGNLNPDEKNELFNVILDTVLDALDKTANAATAPRNPFNFGGMDPLAMALMADMLGKKVPAPDKKPATFKKPQSEDEILNDFLGKICH